MDPTGESLTAETPRAPGALDTPSGEAASRLPEEVSESEPGLSESAPEAVEAKELEAAPEGEAVDSAALARDVLDEILQAMSVPASVAVQRQADGTVRLLVEGPEMGVVIGKHGTTINALQYLVGLIVQKRSGERLRLVIDAEGYRSRREQALREMARTYAQRVKETGHEAVLDALQSYERRIIHTSLADDPDVFTYSEGEEPDRRVVISPRESEAEG